jgi:serine/threonine-protein kinase HipA
VLSLDSDFHIYRRHGRKTKVWATVREWKVHFENSGVPDEQIEKVARAFRHLDDISSADVRKLLP